jgi:hypothetical protein
MLQVVIAVLGKACQRMAMLSTIHNNLLQVVQ